MANTYTQIYLHMVFAVASREALIAPEWKNDLYRYMTGAFQKRGHKIIAIGGMPDHVHVFIGYKITDPVPDMVQSIKIQSSRWVNDHKLTRCKFAWQSGYGAFSYSRDRIPSISNYISNQESHHKNVTFINEYQRILRQCGIDYNPQFLFNEI